VNWWENPKMDVHLRTVRESDFDFVDRLGTDSTVSEPFEWFGFRFPETWSRERWAKDRFLEGDLRFLAVASGDDQIMGWVSWRQGVLSPQPGVVEIGALLLPEYRGQGHGTIAQRLLVDYLFATSPVHRIWAGTEVDNLAEQKALEKCGFTKEGLLRQSVFRDGQWRDGVVYGLLRHET
jgi:RimJ/RimL family protein N-acetyltransferase